MLELLDRAGAGAGAGAAIDEAVRADAARAGRRIPPLWDLDNYVAVNPFLGFAGRPIAEAAAEAADGLGASVLPGVAYYRERWRAGALDPAGLAREAAGSGRDPRELEAILAGRVAPPTRPAGAVRAFAERIGGPWHDAVLRQAARWCAVHASGGGAFWRAGAEMGLYPSWREAARVDRSLEIAGLRGWRRWAAGLPEDAEAAIAAMLARLGVPADDREAYFYRLLGGLYGWASFLRRSTWRRDDDGPGPLLDLLAIRICGDAAVVELAPAGGTSAVAAEPPEDEVEDESVRLAFQEALEDGYVRRVLRRLAPPLPPPPGPAIAERPSVQAVFCIDVRSEPLRRHLEAQDPGLRTLGFAGFFGVPIAWEGDGTARCPVLLEPSAAVGPAGRRSTGGFRAALKSLLAAPASAFTFVELLGLAYGLGLAADATAPRDPAGPPEGSVPLRLDPVEPGPGIPPALRVEMAAGLLRNLGLRGPIARLVLLCGHEGRAANNPHAAGLQCGACGGHGGALNARVASALLNDPSVRAELARRGWPLPDDTRFIAGVHDTSVDRVRLLDADRVPPGHRDDLDRLRRWLEAAGAAARAERAPALGLEPGPALERRLERRARDASEVRPEWALARNAAFIAARRDRTRGVDLEGRSFLHEYDEADDPDDSVLALILSAPMVVASWINWQYLASTVDNRAFGCGTKALHNRVGTLGVVLGNGGDLRTGLAIQSVHGADGRWFHEPIRLQVIVEASRDRIARVLSARAEVRDLVENGWVRLFALDPGGPGVARWVPGRGWEDTPGPR